MGRYVVEVTVSTHDALRVGVVEQPRCPGSPPFHRVVVDADSDRDAVLVAAQMASATSGGMCTSAVLVDFPVPA